MDARAAATRWADVWERAWPAADIEAISALGAEDTGFRRFRADGLVEEQRDMWASEDGRVELPAWAAS